MPTYNLRIQSNSASNRPGTNLGTLTRQGSLPIPAGLAKFTANDGIQLAANTDYWLVFDVTANPSFDYKIYEIASDDENADSSAGWSIANRSLFRSWNVTSWSTDTTSAVLAVWGYSNQIEGIELDPRFGAFTIPFDRALKPHHCPILGAWTVTVDGENRRVVSGRCDSQSVWLRLSRHTGWFAPGQEVTLSYDKANATIGTQGRRLKYADDDSEVENFSLNLQKGTFVAETEVTGATVSGSRLTLTFDEALDEGSAPPGSAFRLKAFFRDGVRDCLAGCAVKGIGRARVSGDTVTVDLDTHISGGRVKVEYHAPSDSPLRTSAGRTVPSYRGASAIVTLAVTDTTPPTLQSAKVYTGNPHEAWVILTFDEDLMGPPPLDSDFHVTVNGERRNTRYSSGIVFGRTARVLLDAPVSAGDAVKVGYTRRGYRPWDHWTSLRDPSFNKVESFSDVPVSVTGGPPVLVGAGADGTRLTVTFNEPLDATSVPAPGDFHVTVGASRRNVAADGVAIDGATAVLSLASAVTSADTVTMRYTRGKNPLLDLDGDAVSTFADQAVANDTAGPQFASAGVDGRTLTVIFDKTLDETSVPAPGDFHVTVGSARRNVAAGGVAVDGAAVRLTLASAARKADTVKVGYTKGTNPLRSPGGSEVETFADRTVANTAAPTFVGAQADGETITLTFDEPLDEASVPAPGDFFVVVGPDRRDVAGGGVAIDGAAVRLTLSWPAAAGERVILRYSKYTNPLRDPDGNEVENFASTDHTVSNLTAPPEASGRRS